MNNAKIGAAVLGGYVLGRTKKAKLALSLGALLAGSQIKPGQLVKAVQKSPFLSNVTQQVRTELTDASKAAATSVLTAKADSLADAIHERTAGLHDKAHPGDEGDRGEADRATELETGGESSEAEDREDEAGQEEEHEADEGRPSRKAEASRSVGREKKTQPSGSDHEEGKPRSRKTTARTTTTRARCAAGRTGRSASRRRG